MLVCTCHRWIQNGDGTREYIRLCTCVYAGATILDPALEIANQTFTPEQPNSLFIGTLSRTRMGSDTLSF